MNNVMGKPREEPPDQWATWKEGSVIGVGGEVYYTIVAEGIKAGDDGHNVWVWHWHTPTEGAHRWSLSSCGNHSVIQVKPLTLAPSLACENGCPSHGFLENGIWRAV